MSLYENVFITRQDISTQSVEKLTRMFSDIISQHGGKVALTEYWGLRQLAYTIKKNRKGHYVMLVVNAPYAGLQEMLRQMRYNEDIIRVFTTKIDAVPTRPSPMLQAQE